MYAGDVVVSDAHQKKDLGYHVIFQVNINGTYHTIQYGNLCKNGRRPTGNANTFLG